MSPRSPVSDVGRRSRLWFFQFLSKINGLNIHPPLQLDASLAPLGANNPTVSVNRTLP